MSDQRHLARADLNEAKDSTVEHALGLEAAQAVLALTLRVVLVEQLLVAPALSARPRNRIG